MDAYTGFAAVSYTHLDVYKRQANIDGVGTVTGLQITERGGGGVAKKLLVTGTEGEKTISGQNSIRAALGLSLIHI